MVSINSLYDKWDSDGPEKSGPVAKGIFHCQQDLKEASRTNWESVTNPPRGSEDNLVIILSWDDLGWAWHLGKPSSVKEADQGWWAWLDDVVLLPEI